jgi:hypothetical protein
MTAEAVGAEAVFQLFDAVLALATIIVESEELGGVPGVVGGQEPQVGTRCGVFGLVADARWRDQLRARWRGKKGRADQKSVREVK